MYEKVHTIEATVIYDLIKKYVAHIKEKAGNDFLFCNEYFQEMHVFQNYLWKTDMYLGIILCAQKEYRNILAH